MRQVLCNVYQLRFKKREREGEEKGKIERDTESLFNVYSWDTKRKKG